MPPNLYKDLHIKSVKDGSITVNGTKYNAQESDYVGRELVTGVLRGDAGFKQLQSICNAAAKRCDINETCGIHAHIGNLNFDKDFIVYAYKLALLMEEEMFSILPPSRKKNEYCSPLAKKDLKIDSKLSKEEYSITIDDHYRNIFKYLCNEEPSAYANKKKNHPRGSRVGYDKRHPRYCWLNFVPAMFNTKNAVDDKGNIVSYTLEFRNHSASLNYTKIRNWVLICMAFVHCIEAHKPLINAGKITTLEEMVSLAYKGKRRNNLIGYITKRKGVFSSIGSSAAEAKDYAREDVATVKNSTYKELVQN
jgi:hypothetical protein